MSTFRGTFSKDGSFKDEVLRFSFDTMSSGGILLYISPDKKANVESIKTEMSNSYAKKAYCIASGELASIILEELGLGKQANLKDPVVVRWDIRKKKYELAKPKK